MMAGGPEYQLAHIQESRVTQIFTSGIICLVAAHIAVILRFSSRRIGKVPIEGDDWSILFGLVSPIISVLQTR